MSYAEDQFHLYYMDQGRELRQTHQSLQQALHAAFGFKDRLIAVTRILGPETDLTADEVEQRYKAARKEGSYKPT